MVIMVAMVGASEVRIASRMKGWTASLRVALFCLCLRMAGSSRSRASTASICAAVGSWPRWALKVKEPGQKQILCRSILAHARFLGDVGKILPDLLDVFRQDSKAVDADDALRDPHSADQGLEQGGLAAARFTRNTTFSPAMMEKETSCTSTMPCMPMVTASKEIMWVP